MWHPLRALRRALPRNLFGRSLIIIVAPMVLLQGIVTYAFFERHYDIMTLRMTRGVAGDVAFLVNLVETHPDTAIRQRLLAIAARDLDYRISFHPGAHITGPKMQKAPHINDILRFTFRDHLGEEPFFSSRILGDYLDLSIDVKAGTLRLLIPKDRMIAGDADIFILWMVISAFVLLSIAIIFLRNQVRPIEQLAKASEDFGRGRNVPYFKPRGATEVRSAALAFMTMRARIERYVHQRTEMLAGVSHDLKTPLTRMKLQLAMMDDSEAEPLSEDIAEMERMLDEYLDFARGEGGEDAKPTDLSNLVRKTAEAAARGENESRISTEIEAGLRVAVKRNALRRCMNNLIDNALKHGSRAVVGLRSAPDERHVEILVDDDGPGIPEERREEAFRPFHRLDEGRNLQTGGSGLGLAIARDITRAHGGELTLDDSPLGGLRAVIRLPV